MLSKLEAAAHDALTQAEILLASETPGYQILPVIRLALDVFEADMKKDGSSVTEGVFKQAESEIAKIEKEVEAEVKKVVTKKKATAKPTTTKDAK